MNPRTTGILLLVALALGAFVYFYEIGGEDARREAEQRGKRLFRDIEPADVRWIALRTADGAEARFEQREGEWQIVAPIAFPADPAVGRMADALATATTEATFEKPQPDAEYGLDDASARIVRFGVGDAEHVLRIGKDTPVGANVYVRADDSTAVHTIAGYRAMAFAKPLVELRDKQIVSFDPSAVREVELRWPDARVVLARGAAEPEGAEDGGGEGEGEEARAEEAQEGEAGEGAAAEERAWRMTAPVDSRGDGEAIDGLLSTLSYLRADGFVDAPTPEQLALFEPADFEVVLRHGEPPAPIAVAISRPAPDDERLVRAGGEVLFEIPASRIADFPREVAAYRDRHLTHFTAADAAKIDFFFHSPESDPVAIEAEREGGEWSSQPEAFGEGRLEAIAWELSRLEASDILAESMGDRELAQLGLSPPNTIVTVLGVAPAPDAEAKSDVLEPPAPRLAELHFGDVTSEGVVARVAGSPIVYRLPPDTAERVPVNLQAFRNRFQAPPEPPPPPAEPDTPDLGDEGGAPSEESP